ncbi:MAG: acyl-CoA dehydrogenase family protein, partial [Syntrophothermus sp.]
RRAPDAEPGDQVLVLTRAEQMKLDPQSSWDPMGMRGTCSPGFIATAEFPVEQILAMPFAGISDESMTPLSHIFWSHVWLGVATDAFDRARAFVRAAAKRSPGEVPSSALRLSSLMSELSLLRAEVSLGLREFVDIDESDRSRLSEMATILRFNNLKVAASEQAPRVCQGAMAVCGIVGYKNDTPFSVGRHLRDSMSACLMVANERIHKTDASLLLIAKEV